MNDKETIVNLIIGQFDWETWKLQIAAIADRLRALDKKGELRTRKEKAEYDLLKEKYQTVMAPRETVEIIVKAVEKHFDEGTRIITPTTETKQ